MKPQYRKKIIRIYDRKLSFKGVIHIVRTHKGEERGQAKCVRLRTKEEGDFKVAHVRKKNFLDHKISKLLFFCTTEAITLPFTTVYREV